MAAAHVVSRAWLGAMMLCGLGTAFRTPSPLGQRARRPSALRAALDPLSGVATSQAATTTWATTLHALHAPRGVVSVPERHDTRISPHREEDATSQATSLAIADARADLPDPRLPVVVFAVLLVAFGMTQIGIVGVVQEEDRLGAEPGRKARDQMARRRGYFRKQQ